MPRCSANKPPAAPPSTPVTQIASPARAPDLQDRLTIDRAQEGDGHRDLGRAADVTADDPNPPASGPRVETVDEGLHDVERASSGEAQSETTARCGVPPMAAISETFTASAFHPMSYPVQKLRSKSTPSTRTSVVRSEPRLRSPPRRRRLRPRPHPRVRQAESFPDEIDQARFADVGHLRPDPVRKGSSRPQRYSTIGPAAITAGSTSSANRSKFFTNISASSRAFSSYA